MHEIRVTHKINKTVVTTFQAESQGGCVALFHAWFQDTDVEELELYDAVFLWNGSLTSIIWLCDWNDIVGMIQMIESTITLQSGNKS